MQRSKLDSRYKIFSFPSLFLGLLKILHFTGVSISLARFIYTIGTLRSKDGGGSGKVA